MSTLNIRAAPFLTTSGSTWSTTANSVDGAYGANNATYATFTSVVSGAVGYIEVGFGTQITNVIPATATGISVTFTVRHLETNITNISTVVAQTYDGATAIGTALTCTKATTARSDTSAARTPTIAQLRSSTFKVRVTATRAANTSAGNFSLDYVDMQITYTVAPVTNFTLSPTPVSVGQTVTFTNTSTGDAATSWLWKFGTGSSPAIATTVGPHSVTYSMPNAVNNVSYKATNAAGNLEVFKPITIRPKVEDIRDTFETEKTAIWPVVNRYGTVAFSGGRVALTERTNPPAYSGILTDQIYDFMNSSVSVKLTPPAVQTASTETTLSVRDAAAANGIFFVVYWDPGQAPNQQQIDFRLRVAGVPNDAWLTYDAATMAYVRIRHAVGTYYWDTSPDGITWTNRRSLANALVLNTVGIELSVGQWAAGEPTQSIGYFDNLNCVPASNSLPTYVTGGGDFGGGP